MPLPGVGSDKAINGTMDLIPPDNVPLTDSLDPLRPALEEEEDEYDYKGALLFVVGLLSVYGVAILLLIVSLIRKSRSALEVKDHQRDFEAMKRASQKRSLRMSRENSVKAMNGGNLGRLSLSSKGKGCLESLPLERVNLCKVVNEENDAENDSPRNGEKIASFSTLRRPPLVSPVISALRATEDHKTVAL